MNPKSKPLWSWDELCSALGQPKTAGPDILGTHFDSRLIREGDLFIPLMGNVDGHEFIPHALANGAVGTLTENDEVRAGINLRVEDTLTALWDLARFRRRQLHCPVVAVTGSSGKTTFQCFLSSILKIPPLEGSFNNHIGVPLSMVRTPVDARYAIFELGTNHTGEIAPLSRLTNPDVAVLLNVLEAHIGNFESFATLEQEKFAITSGLNSKGTFVLPHSLLSHKYRSWGRECLTFGFEKDADLTVRHDKDYWYHFSSTKDEIRVEVPGGGNHRALTLAACATVLLALQIPLKKLQAVTLDLPNGRGNTYSVADITIIDDSYNANPSSVREALKVLRDNFPNNRKVVVIGQMNELGDKSTSYHEDLAKHMKNIDLVYCVGELALPLFEKLYHKSTFFFQSADETLLASLEGELRPRDTVMIKGSNTVFWQYDFTKKLISRLRQRTNQ
ncbi:MAG: UDP-N-acetylmuramoyl-tripeptide--D-alanyl-D-alanine ligase [Gammaproteobacteria bacterium]|nr:UDP-N-acetylmuramoyl-tripeptide--D-alanyl-D-alanine ligase [Gammaproteobacteria bacterium]MDE0252987.1 UDP-N-acetylmuramoyl-tripeptide--D-alanyl-D-alanine ligase [Gammaproteobacteria bacterium]MDE0403669.1 UDP-N-acetylmuramoyl-tripeptide--D-alanyl-D-alanine ligase [Gammaproteobacteria bacterium]